MNNFSLLPQVTFMLQICWLSRTQIMTTLKSTSFQLGEKHQNHWVTRPKFSSRPIPRLLTYQNFWEWYWYFNGNWYRYFFRPQLRLCLRPKFLRLILEIVLETILDNEKYSGWSFDFRQLPTPVSRFQGLTSLTSFSGFQVGEQQIAEIQFWKPLQMSTNLGGWQCCCCVDITQIPFFPKKSRLVLFVDPTNTTKDFWKRIPLIWQVWPDKFKKTNTNTNTNRQNTTCKTNKFWFCSSGRLADRV